MKWALIGLLLLAGCVPPKVNVPPPPALSKVVFTWTGTGNPSMQACAVGVDMPCLVSYVLTDGTTILASPAIGALTYSIPTPAKGAHTYGLAVNVLNKDGSITPSPKALSVAVIQ